uniref:KH-like RNA-binding domain-containing protein n=1 Tax=Suricata suricatta TaxID=37032 RepID=A0A673T7G9_SURSU
TRSSKVAPSLPERHLPPLRWIVAASVGLQWPPLRLGARARSCSRGSLRTRWQEAAARPRQIRATGARRGLACSPGLRYWAAPAYRPSRFPAGRGLQLPPGPDGGLAQQRRTFLQGPGRIDLRIFQISRGAPATPEVFDVPVEPASKIFGPDRAIIPEIEWMSQVLLTVDIVKSGDLVEITIYGQPRVQNRVKSVLLSLANWHRKHRARAEKMKQLEEFLKAHASGPQTPEHRVA